MEVVYKCILATCIRVHVSLSRGKKMRLFLSGDYEFLCRMYGLSGASGQQTDIHVHIHVGRHCCLWCTVTRGEIKLSPEQQPPATLRTVSMLIQDHQQFLASGGALKNAKNYNNCIGEPLFDIPLEQVLCFAHVYMTNVRTMN